MKASGSVSLQNSEHSASDIIASGASEPWFVRFFTYRKVVVLLLLTAIGFSGIIASKFAAENAAIKSRAEIASVNLNRLIAPSLATLESAEKLNASNFGNLEKIVSNDAAISSLVGSIRVWSREGTILFEYRRDPSIPMSHNLSAKHLSAREGQITYELEYYSPKNTATSEIDGHWSLLRAFAPIRHPRSNAVIAILEFTETADQLAADLKYTGLKSSIIFVSLGLMMMVSFAALLHHVRDRDLIRHQKEQLAARVDELARSLQENQLLQKRVLEASHRSATAQEEILKRVGSDLHDGPTQLISLALLRLDNIDPVSDKLVAKPVSDFNIEIIRDALSDALADIRQICSSFVTPEIEKLSVDETIQLAIRKHRQHSRTEVGISLDTNAPYNGSVAMKTFAYRFVQEALNNSFKHAGGVGQFVRTGTSDDSFYIEVSDMGPGIGEDFKQGRNGSLGLKGLKDRAESIGGKFEISSALGTGALLRASIPLTKEVRRHA